MQIALCDAKRLRFWFQSAVFKRELNRFSWYKVQSMWMEDAKYVIYNEYLISNLSLKKIELTIWVNITASIVDLKQLSCS